MTTPLSNATNIRIEVRLAGADGFAIVTAPMLMLDSPRPLPRWPPRCAATALRCWFRPRPMPWPT